MAGVLDFLFGSGTLKKVADVPQADHNYTPGTVNQAKANEDYAAKKLAADAALKAKPKAKAIAKPAATESSPGYDWRQDQRNAK